jgi:putative SOS response-associated peptidase YedK
MCYDISFTSKFELISEYIPNIIMDGQIEINYDAMVHIMGHAYGFHPIVYVDREDMQMHCRLMEWGCIPFYIKDEKTFIRQRATMLNARSERILGDEKSYWYKIRNRRCLIPVTGFYEHRAIKGWKKKVPYYITLKSQAMFFIPGLYSVVELPDLETGEVVKRYTYSLITRDANDVMRNIHNDGENRGRMPLMVPLEMALDFIKEDLSPDRYKEILNFEMPSEELSYTPVYTIRSPKDRPDGMKKNKFWEWEKLPALGEANPD